MSVATNRDSFRAALPAARMLIERASTIALLSHYSPDPDAFGSQCGLGLALESAGKQIILVNQDGAVEGLRFIPSADRVSKVVTGAPDLFIVCDCGDIKRVGDSLEACIKAAPQVINLDHHASNDLFGSVHLVDETASSSSELALELIEYCGLPINPDIASALLAGLMADTGSFRYSSTTAVTLEAGARLVRAGAVPNKVSQQLYSRQSLTTIKLHAESLLNLRLFEEGALSVLVVTQEMVKRLGAVPDDSEGLVERGRDIQGVKVSALIRWVDDLWRVSLRSRDPRWDVSLVAQFFGGGGHKAAAAFRWRRSLEELEALLIPKLCELARGT